MLRRLVLRDVVIVAELELDLRPGFSVLTGETGAGKSILIDALQLALGQRADASLVREGASRAEVSAEFDRPASLLPWLAAGGFDADDTLLLRRSVDAQGKSRAWLNGSPATAAQLREAAEHLVDIHGQHAWQSLTRPAAVRALLDAQAGADETARTVAAAWQAWRRTEQALSEARAHGDTLARERERLAWQIGEVEKLAPAEAEWETLNTEHGRQAHAQALVEGAQAALDATSEGEDNACQQLGRALAALHAVQRFDPELGALAEQLQAAQALLEDVGLGLRASLKHREPDPERLAELDARLAVWMALARRYRRPPNELPALLQGWRDELGRLDAASDLAALEAATLQARSAWAMAADDLSRRRRKAAPALAAAVTAVMQSLGMAGGRFEVALLPLPEPANSGSQGQEAVEFRVAGHAGSTPRALAKVASGGELSRLALAIAVTTARAAGRSARRHLSAAPRTLVFDEIDAGVGGTVADSVGRLMRQLGRELGPLPDAGDSAGAAASGQVLAVTHLAQVAACADGHFVVSKAAQRRQTLSSIAAVEGQARVAEIARMLGGTSRSGLAHAQALIGQADTPARPPSGPLSAAAANSGATP